MKLFVLAAVIACAAATSEAQLDAFDAFTATHDKVYATRAEYNKRAAIFTMNLEKIAAMNAIHGESVFGVGPFTDLTHDEFKASYLMNYVAKNVTEFYTPTAEAALAIDWRTRGVLTAVKDQGQCGSCWAFSATAAIESYAKLNGGYSLMELSPQQINSCDTRDGGCNGGNTETAYNYVRSAGGIETERNYPYTSGTGRTGSCKVDSSKFAVKIAGYKSVSRGENNLASALNDGPVSICVAADAFQHYRSGILTSCPGNIDHCVQAVGYTADTWIVRNSWGTGWGESGFIRIARGSNLCHIADDVTFPTF